MSIQACLQYGCIILLASFGICPLFEALEFSCLTHCTSSPIAICYFHFEERNLDTVAYYLTIKDCHDFSGRPHALPSDGAVNRSVA